MTAACRRAAARPIKSADRWGLNRRPGLTGRRCQFSAALQEREVELYVTGQTSASKCLGQGDDGLATYTLRVFNPGDVSPIEIVGVERAVDLVDLIPVLLARHSECHRIRAYLHETFLFAVDCHGQNAPD